LGLELLDFLQPKCSVHSSSHYFNVTIALQNLRNQLAHERGIIYHQHPDLLTHAVAPMALRIRASREITLAIFKIRTTVPSPRIEAPLTISVATRWSSRALMTSSSSPI